MYMFQFGLVHFGIEHFRMWHVPHGTIRPNLKFGLI
jgi:hypothetical protein